MRWESVCSDDGSGEPWIEARDQLGDWAIEESGGVFVLVWYPPFLQTSAVHVGDYRSQKSAKAAAKRYAKKLAAACKAFARMGWT
jgi:hypothetical protein